MEVTGTGSARPGRAKFDLAALRRQASSREIADPVLRDGDEIVWCGEQDGEYVGWTTRENADAKGYAVVRTDEDPATLALIEVVEAAIEYRGAQLADDWHEPHNAGETWVRLEAASARLAEALSKFEIGV